MASDRTRSRGDHGRSRTYRPLIRQRAAVDNLPGTTRRVHEVFAHIGLAHRQGAQGRSRLDEQRAVLREIVQVTRDHRVDAVLVAGDLYESSAPSADAQQLLVQALLTLRRTGAEVIAIAGNHDHAPTFDAYRPLMASAGITLAGSVRVAADGGVVKFTARSTREPVTVALLPFLSQRYAVRAAQLVSTTPRRPQPATADWCGTCLPRSRPVSATMRSTW